MLCTVSTIRTYTAGISRINQEYSYTRLLCFVRDVRSQLVKRPTIEVAALLTLNSSSCSNVCQIFKRECLRPGGTRFRRLSNQAFTDSMVRILLKTPLFARQFLQAALGILRATFLQAAAILMVTFAYPIHLLAAKCFAVAIHAEVDDAQVTTQDAGRFIRVRRFLGLSDVEIPAVASAHQFSAANLPCQVVQIAPLKVAQVKLANNSPCDGVEADLIPLHQAVGTSVVTDAAIRIKGWARCVVMLPRRSYRFCRFISGTARQLRTQAKLSTSRTIDFMMERVFIRDALLPRHLSTVGCSRIERGLRLMQRLVGSRINAQLTAYRSCGESIAHIHGIARLCYVCKQEGRFLRRVNTAVSTPIFL